MRISIAVVLIFLCSNSARADVVDSARLDINGLSKHSSDVYYDRNSAIQKFNKENYGLGIVASFKSISPRSVEFSAGFYKNSYYKNSYHAGVNLKQDFTAGPITFSPGVYLSVTTGYDGVVSAAKRLQPAVLANVHVRYQRFGVTVGYTPVSLFTDDPNAVSVVTLQISYWLKMRGGNL